MKSQLLSGLVVVLGLAAACSDSTAEGDAAPSGSSKQIGSEGGTVTEGDASVEVPGGALESSVKIGIAESAVKVDPPAGYLLAGPAIAFTPHGLEFKVPVTLTLPYDSDAAELAVLRLDDEQDKSWEVVPGGEFAGSLAKLEVSSFSIYAVAEAAAQLPGAGGAGGAADVPMITAGMGGAGDSAGASAVGGAPSGGGELVRSCDGTSVIHTCTESTWPALVVELLGGADKVPPCQAPAAEVASCDTTGAVLGCVTTDADDIPGLTVINWFYDGTEQDLRDGVFCNEANSEWINPP